MSELRQRKHQEPTVPTGDYAEKYIDSIADKVPSSIAVYLKTAAPFVKLFTNAVVQAIPYFILAYQWLLSVWNSLSPYKPELLLPAFVGLILCFFGGSFFTLIAAVEAYKLCGYEATLTALKHLREEFLVVLKEEELDDKKDENNDGIPDVLQITNSELVTRKTLLFLRSVDPNRISNAGAAIYSGLVAVAACLKLQFAKAIALGHVIGVIFEVSTSHKP